MTRTLQAGNFWFSRQLLLLFSYPIDEHKEKGTIKVYDDNQLIKGCLQQNRLIQKALFDRFSEKMFGLCLRYAKDREEAQNMLQDGFARVFRYIHKFKGQSKLETWIHRVMINSCLQTIKSRKDWLVYQDQQDPLADKADDFQVSSESKLNEKDLIHLIENLPLGYRTVFNMYAIEGYSHKEIAKELNVSESTSKTQLFKARKLLQLRLTEMNKKYNVEE